MNSQTWWFVARSGGMIAWAMLALSVFWGLALSSRFLGKKPRPNWMLDLHRFIGGLAVVFTAVHVIALVADSYVSFGLVQILVPFTGDYHPAAVAWGVVAMYFLLAVEITSLLRKRLSKRMWRATHMLSFPLFASSTVHMLTVGTDRSQPALRIAAVLVVAAITLSTFIRVAQIERRPPTMTAITS
ncbi:MAG: Flavodoxin reductase (ferredoxin-NADPH reductase) family 1 [Ilumatobacteraceae bacterium]|nr:Flavodoxin reductase (ferredoxin-NADPH reductase) family 1 [Ilumatobacteraceae bacterium]